VCRFLELLRDLKTLNEKDYAKKEKKIIKVFELRQRIIEWTLAMMEAEEAAFVAAGIEEGTVEYK
jgi:hypothetical protein